MYIWIFLGFFGEYFINILIINLIGNLIEIKINLYYKNLTIFINKMYILSLYKNNE